MSKVPTPAIGSSSGAYVTAAVDEEEEEEMPYMAYDSEEEEEREATVKKHIDKAPFISTLAVWLTVAGLSVTAGGACPSPKHTASTDSPA